MNVIEDGDATGAPSSFFQQHDPIVIVVVYISPMSEVAIIG